MPRRSKLEMLPPHLKNELERLLLDRTHDGYEALAAWLNEHGIKTSKSGVHRYNTRLQKVRDQIMASMEAARMLVQMAPDDMDEQSAVVIRMMQSALFDAILKIIESSETNSETNLAEQVKMLSEAALAIARAIRASIDQKRLAEEFREKTSTQDENGGRKLDIETLNIIRDNLYGG